MALSPIRRVVTGHDTAGRSVVIFDDIPPVRGNPSGTSLFSLIWTSQGSPIDNDDATDGGARKVDLTLPGGSVIRVLDMQPGSVAPMHRTNSLDYGIVISGSIELLLDDGFSTLIEPGGVVVQRGTNHSWRNPSADEIARVAFVLLDAKPATVDGAPLREVHPSEGIEP